MTRAIRIASIAAILLAVAVAPVHATLIFYSGSTSYGSTFPSAQATIETFPTYWCAAHDSLVKQCFQWNYARTDSDDEERGPKITATDRRCPGNCTASTSTADLTVGSGTSVQYSASTSWDVGCEWAVVKDVFSVSAGYGESNTTTYEQ